jgi:hypothetical protein
MRAIWITLLIIVFSIIAVTIMVHWIGWSIKKSVIVAVGAALAMILFDVVLPSVRHRDK